MSDEKKQTPYKYAGFPYHMYHAAAPQEKIESLMPQPILQPTYINKSTVAYTPIHKAVGTPQPSQYSTTLEPVFLDHLSQHQGKEITVRTDGKEVTGTLAGVTVDHIQLNLNANRALHIRVADIAYFEGLPIS